MRKRLNKKRETCIGLVINTAIKPSRDVMLGIMEYVREDTDISIIPRLFHASPATTAPNLKAFAESGIDGLIFCGVRKEIVGGFLNAMPNHPPTVVVANFMIPEQEMEKFGVVGQIVLDNEKIGEIAADIFIEHGLTNFAFFGSNGYREMMAGKIRCEAFRRRLEEKLGGEMSFSPKMSGTLADNEDFWVGKFDEVLAFIKSLPLPCGLLVNGDREAFGLSDICHRQRIDVPDQVEILGVNNSFGLCERARPAISSIQPDHETCARKAVEMLLALIDDPKLPQDRRIVKVDTHKFVARGSTSIGRDFGRIAVRAREFIRANACSGISVSEVANHVGVSRRTLEKRFSEAMGQTVQALISSIKLEHVCHLLKTTDLPIMEVTLQSGYQPTSNLGILFKRTYGVSMRQYRNNSRK